MRDALVFTICLLFFFAVEGLAVDTGFTPGTQENLPAGAPSQEGCWEEEIRSAGSDPILSNPSMECHRIVCDGNFWGKSAVDICCDSQEITEGEGEEEVIYKNCHVRRPLTKEASEPWREKRFYIKQPLVGCGNHLVPIEEMQQTLGANNSILDHLVDSLLPQVFASNILENRSYVAWTEDEKVAVANLIRATADLIETKLAEGNPMEVGEEWSLFSQYTWSTLYSARFLAHLFDPARNLCPEPLAGLCSITDLLFHPVWFFEPCIPGFCIVGETDSLNVIAINQTFQISSNSPVAFGTAPEAVMHEVWHIVYHYSTGLYQYPDPNDQQEFQTHDFSKNVPPSLIYEEESTARFIEAIFYHFFKQLHPEWESRIYAPLENLWDALQLGTTLSLIDHIPDAYKTYIYRQLTNSQIREVAGCIRERIGNLPAATVQDMPALRRTFASCVALVLGFVNAEELLQKMENEIYGRGGPCGIVGSEMTPWVVVTPCQNRDADQSRNEVSNPNTFNPSQYNIEGSPPPSDFDFEPPQQSWSDTTNIPNNCALALKSNSYSRECANWCWNHFPNGRDGGICQKITKYDAEKAGCNLSTGNKCESAVAAICKDHSDWYPKACAKLCAVDPSKCLQPTSSGGSGGGGGSGTNYASELESVYGLTCPAPWIEYQNRAICEHGLGAHCYPFVGKVLCCSGQLGGTYASLWNSERNAQGQFCIPKPGAYNPTCPNRIWCGCGIGKLQSSNGCCSFVEACGLPSEPGPDVYACGSYSDSGGCQCVKTGECTPQ